ncbi:MAG: lipoprotein signal peptidase [Bacteroidia bacterium]|nr:lipoprotein signal peptidase [Bacteroidia bacterium]MCZ2139845.1 lipoprotein signal peptidase [Bacteroidia bacterium]
MLYKKLTMPAAVVCGVLLIDQLIKLYIKKHFYLGEEIMVLGKWFRIHFTENYGMAFGLEFGGKSGKILLTLFRIVAVGFISWYIFDLSKKQSNKWFIFSWALILAGALGNIIDSIFYGKLFGYDDWFHGRVVDMFYFPIIQTTIPDNWIFWAGEDFEFFRPVFNFADAAISIGFVIILLWQKTFFNEKQLNNQES